jgi:hypothetical protein
MRRWLALVAACAALPAHAVTLVEIAATLAAVDASRARFTEVRTIAALGTPIERPRHADLRTDRASSR